MSGRQAAQLCWAALTIGIPLLLVLRQAVH